MKSNQFLSEDLVTDAQEAQQDHEVQMARKDCFHAAEDAVALHRLLRNISEAEGLEGWVSSKITLARDYLNKVREHLEHKLIVQDSELSLGDISDMNEPMLEPKLPIAENASSGSSSAGAVATVNNPEGGKKKSEIGSLFGGTYGGEKKKTISRK
jgi:hypothetical protein